MCDDATTCIAALCDVLCLAQPSKPPTPTHDRWSDGAPDSWEDEEFVSPTLVEQFLSVREEQKRARQAAADAPSPGGGVPMASVSTTKEPVGV